MTTIQILQVIVGLFSATGLAYCAGHDRGYAKGIGDSSARWHDILKSDLTLLEKAVARDGVMAAMDSKLDAVVEWIEDEGMPHE